MVPLSPTGFFDSFRGFRQGYPISPSLFIQLMEVLSCMLMRTLEGGFLEGFRVDGGYSEASLMSHLLFVDVG